MSKYKRDRLEIEKKDTPTNRQLSNLEKTLDKCDNILNDDKARIEALIKNINENNAEINLLQIEIAESKGRVR